MRRRGIRGAPRLRVATAAEEQAWNERQLWRPVRVPRVAVWTYREPAVVLGVSQRPDEVMRAAARAVGLELVQRRSGGGAVLVGRWLLGLSVVLPSDHPLVAPGVTESYRWFGEAHATALRRLGVECQSLDVAAARAVAQERRSAVEAAGIRWACFAALSPWEVVAAGGKKLVGLAQVRRRTGVLFVSGILLSEPEWGPLCRVFGAAADAAAVLSAWTSSCCRELAGRRQREDERDRRRLISAASAGGNS